MLTSSLKIRQAKSRDFGQNEPSREETFCHEDNEIYRGADRFCTQTG